jgi:hypothetical protein
MDLTTISTTTTSDPMTRGPLGPLLMIAARHLRRDPPDRHVHQHRSVMFNIGDGSRDNHPSFTVHARPSKLLLTHIKT